MEHVFSITVENNAGVLSRISGLFSRRGFNIDSLSVGETEDPRYSCMTVSARGDEATMQQLRSQVAKLEEVRSVEELSPDSSVAREYLLIKYACDAESRGKVIDLVGIFRASVVDVTETTLIAELTGTPDKVSAFIRLSLPLNVTQIVRTGMTAMKRG